MKKNRIASMMLASAIVAASMLPSFAAIGGVTVEEQPDIPVIIDLAHPANITITGTGNKFEAYRLLNLTTSLKTGAHDHAAGAHEHDCYNYSYTINAKYDAALKQVTGEESEADIIKALEGMDADAIREFADDMYMQIKDMGADKTAESQKISGVAQGYYLIVEREKGADPDTYSLVMLDTAGQGDITVETKEGTVSLTKKIVEDGKRMDANDYAVGDAVSFELTGTMPDNIDGYAKYQYIFHDSLSAGLQLDASSVKVTIDGTEISSDKYSVKTTGLDNDCSFEVAFADIKAVADVTKDTKVVVSCNAELTAAADKGNPGNPNAAHIEFSSNPYAENDTAHTPEDKVAAFTFEVIVNKVDKDGNALAGANFKLMKLEGGDYVEYKTIDVADGQTAFSFSGLDSGKYKLVETKVPDGYNKADDVEFEIVSGMDEESDDPALTELKIMNGEEVLSEGEDAVFTISLDAGSATTQVINTTGIRLPSTGGMGNYVIYGAAGALVAGGIVLAVIKRKENLAG